MELPTGDALAAEGLAGDPEVAAARGALLAAVTGHGAGLTGVRPPHPARAGGYAEAVDALQRARGARLVYPYIGSGIGRGALVELADGSVKYDLIAGIGTHHLGHSHPVVVAAALDAALSDVVMEGYLQPSAAAGAFSDLLLRTAGGGGARLAHCFVATSGVMACENALKVAFQARAPADRVLAFEGCFAGRTVATAQITDRPGFREGLPTALAVDYVPFFDERDPDGSTGRALAALDGHLRRYPGRHAAMLFELVLGEGGFYAGSAAFHRVLMERCRAAGALVLVDEVQTFLRTSRPFAFQHYGLDELVDVVWVGKASQACATLFSADVAPRPGLLAQTFTASASALRCGAAVIGHLVDGAYFGPDGRLTLLADRFVAGLQDVARRRPGLLAGPWGCGAMVGCTPHDGSADAAGRFLRDLFDRGVIALQAGERPTRARFLLPVGGLETGDVDACLELTERSLVATAGG